MTLRSAAHVGGLRGSLVPHSPKTRVLFFLRALCGLVREMSLFGVRYVLRYNVGV